MKVEKLVIAVDMDGTLTTDTCFTPKECETAKPNQKIINWVARKSRGNFIIIYTARRDDLIPDTLRWLRRHNVRFDAISNNKMVADIYIDDRNLTIEQVLKEV